MRRVAVKDKETNSWFFQKNKIFDDTCVYVYEKMTYKKNPHKTKQKTKTLEKSI